MQTKTEMLMNLYNEICSGNISALSNINIAQSISMEAVQLIENQNWNNEDVMKADLILKISNAVYNNTSNSILFLDDGLYDQLIELYKKYNPNYQVGSIPLPTSVNENPDNEIPQKKLIATVVNNEQMDSRMFIRDIWQQNTPIRINPRLLAINVNREPITKRMINTTHKYPELVGTLDKCKFVLNNDAKQANAFDTPSVAVFERDFIHKCLDMDVIRTDEIFEMVGELKYDGVSVEVEVLGDTIISALSRGDTGANIATDLTPIFKGYKFPNASSIPKDTPFGIKFECIITYSNLQQLNMLRGKAYKNCRNAIIGLLGSSDAYNYRRFFTLIPLATSLDFERINELKFLNKYYNTGEYNRYVEFIGNYHEILFQVKQFTESAEILRPILPYLIDGVVISFTDKRKKAMLGRVNSVNKWSMAIKFNPKSVRTIFLGYKFNIGKTGEVIPMVYFKPCEFIGTIHSTQTIHSYKRFKELNLRIGDEIDVDYVNEVITYVTKPDTEHNRNNPNPPEEFIKVCPYCGQPIMISESGNSAYCDNLYCPERIVQRYTSMLDKLGFKDISEERVRALNIKCLKDILCMDYYYASSIIGPENARKFVEQRDQLLYNSINDYTLMAAIGFPGIGDEKWKLIFSNITLKELLSKPFQEISDNLNGVKGISSKTLDNIKNCMSQSLYTMDIETALQYFSNNIIDYKNLASKPKIAITGFRDDNFVKYVNSLGYDCSDSYGVTKNLYALITNNKNSSSSKMAKAEKYGIPIYTIEEFLNNHSMKI